MHHSPIQSAHQAQAKPAAALQCIAPNSVPPTNAGPMQKPVFQHAARSLTTRPCTENAALGRVPSALLQVCTLAKQQHPQRRCPSQGPYHLNAWSYIFVRAHKTQCGFKQHTGGPKKPAPNCSTQLLRPADACSTWYTHKSTQSNPVVRISV